MKEATSEPGSFLERWSRRKRGQEAEHEAESVGATGDAVEAIAEDADRDGETAGEPVVEKDFADFDFDKLDYDSDYEQFMKKDVSSEARHKALRKLWLSNPVLANMDGLDDYCEDYTDAAVCLPKGTMKTLYQYGRGFLNDEEVAEWESLGKESKEIAEAEAEERRAEAEKRAEAEAEAEAASEAEAAANENQVISEADTATGDEVAVAALDADTGPGAACAAAVKQDEAEMLAEYEADNGDGSTKKAG